MKHPLQANPKPRLSRLPRVSRLGWAAASVLVLGLAACGQADDSRTAGQKLDAVVNQVENKADAVNDRIAEGAAEVKQEATEAVKEASRVVTDTAISAAVNAELARDGELSALQIDVDTTDGRVALRGTAPTESAKARAYALAAKVEGVRSVDNQLMVKGG